MLKTRERNAAITKNCKAFHPRLQFQVQFKLLALEPGLCLPRRSRYRCIPQQCAPPACLVSNPGLVLPSDDAGRGVPKRRKPGQSCPATGSCRLHEGGEGHSGCEGDAGRCSLSSAAFVVSCASEASARRFCPAVKNNTRFQQRQHGLRRWHKHQNKGPWETPCLDRNIFSRYLETPVIKE